MTRSLKRAEKAIDEGAALDASEDSTRLEMSGTWNYCTNSSRSGMEPARPYRKRSPSTLSYDPQAPNLLMSSSTSHID